MKSQALRLCDAATGKTLGSGVTIGDPPTLLTCAHVAEAAEQFEIRDGDHIVGRVARSAFQIEAGYDLAIADPIWSVPPKASAIQFTDPAGEVGWSGYPYAELGVNDVLAGRGRVLARTRVAIGTCSVPALQLEGAPPISPGMSGGPLVDLASGAIAGLAASEFSEVLGTGPSRAPGFAGFAVPLSSAFEGGLKASLLRSEATVARFGPKPNKLGALRSFDNSAAEARLYAETRLRYVPGRMVDRGQLLDIVSAFLESDRLILPVVGESGTGKTTFIQGMLRSSDRPCLLARCAGLEPGANLAAMLSAALGLDRAVSPAIRASGLEASALASGPGLLLLDGLNELSSSIDWQGKKLGLELGDLLRAIGWKAVITSRLTAWENAQASFDYEALYLLQPHGSDEDDRIAEAAPARLGDFSAVEREEFLELNGIPGSAGARDIRNPLTLTLSAARGAAASAELNLDDLLEIQLEERIKFIVQKRGASTFVQNDLRSFCAELARHLLLEKRDEIHLKDIVSDRRADFEALLEETVFVPASKGRWRFRYDQMLEHLQAEALPDPVAVLSTPDLLAPTLGETVQASVVIAAVRRLSASKDRSIVHAALRAAAPHGSRFFARLLRSVSLFDQDVEAVEDALGRLAKFEPSGFNVVMITDGFRDVAWRSQRVAFCALRAFALSDDGYGWREKDVERGTYAHMNTATLERAGVRELLQRALAEDRSQAEAELTQWLGSSDSMRGSEGTLGSWTLNLLYSFREDLGFEAVLRMVLQAGDHNMWYSIVAATARDGENGLGALEALASDHSTPVDSLLVGIEAALREDTQSAEGRRRLGALLTTLQGRTVEPKEGARIMRLLASIPEHADTVWVLYKRQVEAGRGRLDPMGEMLQRRPIEAFELLARHWRSLGSASDISSLISRDCPSLTKTSDAALLAMWRSRIDFLQSLIPEYGDHFKYHLEDLLYRMDFEAAKATGLIDLTMVAVNSCGSELAANLRYPLCGRGPDSFDGREVFEHYLCRKIVEEAPLPSAEAILEGLHETQALAELGHLSHVRGRRGGLPQRFHDFVGEMELCLAARRIEKASS